MVIIDNRGSLQITSIHVSHVRSGTAQTKTIHSVRNAKMVTIRLSKDQFAKNAHKTLNHLQT